MNEFLIKICRMVSVAAFCLLAFPSIFENLIECYHQGFVDDRRTALNLTLLGISLFIANMQSKWFK